MSRVLQSSLVNAEVNKVSLSEMIEEGSPWSLKMLSLKRLAKS